MRKRAEAETGRVGSCGVGGWLVALSPPPVPLHGPGCRVEEQLFFDSDPASAFAAARRARIPRAPPPHVS